MHGHISTSAGLIGSVMTCVIGAYNSQRSHIPLPKSPAVEVRPTFDCGYALVSHSAKEVFYPGPDWGIQIQCELRNVKGRDEARLRCTLPFAGAVNSKDRHVQVRRGTTETFVFDFPEPSFVAGVLESLRSNDPDTGYQFEMEEIPSKGWNIMAWIGAGGAAVFAGLLFAPFILSGVLQIPRQRCGSGTSAVETERPASAEFDVFTCSECGQRLRVPKLEDELLVTCPKCRNRFLHRS